MLHIHKTFSVSQSDVKPQWFLVDVSDIALGRAAVQISLLLRGKTSPTYTPHVNPQIHIVVTNIKRVLLTGKKSMLRGKIYHRHTGYPGGLKSTDARDIIRGKTPTKILELAVSRMLPKNKLGSHLMKNLHLYADDSHMHQANQPIEKKLL